ncbi:MAG: hypothetical protein M0Z55_03155 [Peptococcaceae bacterium]|nr:hypothetical protein [Peptococcaceae bacterium]
MEINALGAELNLGATDQGFAQGSFTTYSGRPTVSFVPEMNTAKLTLNSPRRLTAGNVRGEKLALQLTDKIPLDLAINTGAAKGMLDLSHLKVNTLELNTGAADMQLKFCLYIG